MSLRRPSLEESRRRERPIKRCHMCGARVIGGYTFCPNCRDHRRHGPPTNTPAIEGPQKRQGGPIQPRNGSGPSLAPRT